MSTTIGRQLREHIRDAIGSEQTSIEAADEDVRVTADLEHCERYAVGVRGMRVAPSTPNADVGDTAERIARHVDVIEHLRVVEVDTREGQAILRSDEPEADDEGVTYWEASVRPDETTLNRYHKAHAEPDRQAVVEPLTHRDVGDLADQLADAVRGTDT
jgi:hypothetical protein